MSALNYLYILLFIPIVFLIILPIGINVPEKQKEHFFASSAPDKAYLLFKLFLAIIIVIIVVETLVYIKLI